MEDRDTSIITSTSTSITTNTNTTTSTLKTELEKDNNIIVNDNHYQTLLQDNNYNNGNIYRHRDKEDVDIVVDVADVHMYCRTCGSISIDTNMLTCFTSAPHSIIMLQACANIQVSVDDGLPAQMCGNCLTSLVSAYEFKKLCEETDLKLRKKFRDVDPKIEIEVSIKEEPEDVGNNFDNFEDDFQGSDYEPLLIKKKKRDANSDTSYDQDYMSVTSSKKLKKEKSLACYTCGKTFKKTSHLKRHEKTHTDSKPYKCTECSKSYSNEKQLMEHVNKHKGIKPHICPVCSKSFAQSSTLTTHLRVHTKEKPYLCATCGKRFDSSTNLNQHLKRHRGEKTFYCTLCPGRYVSKGELQSHMSTHTGARPFVCDTCGSAFTKTNSLAKHKLIHLGIKPHECDVCAMKFNSKDHLKRHYRIHTGEKPYKCEYCERAFTQSNDLVKHTRSHLGDKMYRCNLCPEGFRLKTELRKHVSVHFIDQTLNLIPEVEIMESEMKKEPGYEAISIVSSTPVEVISDVNNHTDKTNQNTKTEVI